MTTVVAFPAYESTEGGYLLVTDNRVLDGDSILSNSLNKVVSYGMAFYLDEDGKQVTGEGEGRPYALAAAGSWGTINVLQHLFDVPDTAYRLQHAINCSARYFAFALRDILLEHGFKTDTDPEMKDFVAGTLPCDMILTYSSGAFIITAGMDIYPIEHYGAIGSGKVAANAVMETLFKQLPKPPNEEDALRYIFNAAAKADVGTVNRFHAISVDKRGAWYLPLKGHII